MIDKTPTIDDVRQLHSDIIHLVKHELVYAFPSGTLGGPVFKAAVHCTAEEITSAIPLPKLRELLYYERRAFLAALN